MLLLPAPTACRCFFFFNDTATTEIYTLSLHDALPISRSRRGRDGTGWPPSAPPRPADLPATARPTRSEEHTSELQSLAYLVCRLLLEKNKQAGPAQIFDVLPAEERTPALAPTLREPGH